MTSVTALTRQISSLEISNKKPTATSSSKPPLMKQPSGTNVAKLLTKFAAPNPFTNPSNKPANSSSLRNPTPGGGQSSTSKPVHATHSSVDIGNYDGGLELDNEKRGERVYGQAAEELALNSSLSR